MIGDGSAMYTIQSLWTMARENLDVCVMIFSNRSYNILYSQLADVGAANPGPRAIDMLTLDRPTLEFTVLAKGMGVPAAKAHDLEELTKQLTYAMSHEGPVPDRRGDVTEERRAHALRPPSRQEAAGRPGVAARHAAAAAPGRRSAGAAEDRSGGAVRRPRGRSGSRSASAPASIWCGRPSSIPMSG